MFRLSVARDYFTFSSAHFIVGTGDTPARESVHGHNFELRINIACSHLDSNGMVVDFAILKKLLRTEAQRFNQRTIIPLLNPNISVAISGLTVGISAAQQPVILPRADCVFLNVSNITTEALAEHFASYMAQECAKLGLPCETVGIDVIEVDGQEASCTIAITDCIAEQSSSLIQADDALPEEIINEVLSAYEAASEASDQGRSPFAAIVMSPDRKHRFASRNKTQLGTPSEHAEVAAIRGAGFPLADGLLISSCEPCGMCLLTAYYEGIKTIIYGTSLKAAIELGSGDPPIESRSTNAAYSLNMNIHGPIMEDKGIAIFKDHQRRFGQL